MWLKEPSDGGWDVNWYGAKGKHADIHMIFQWLRDIYFDCSLERFQLLLVECGKECNSACKCVWRKVQERTKERMVYRYCIFLLRWTVFETCISTIIAKPFPIIIIFITTTTTIVIVVVVESFVFSLARWICCCWNPNSNQQWCLILLWGLLSSFLDILHFPSGTCGLLKGSMNNVHF